MNATLYRVILPYATYGLVVEGGWVRDVAPIANWMVGKSLVCIQSWVASKGGKVEEVQQ